MENNSSNIWCCCIKLKTLAVSIGFVFFLCQAIILAVIFFNMTKAEEISDFVLDWFANEADIVEDYSAKQDFLELKLQLSKVCQK